ncbi:MAG: putative Ig domain-containing protein [Terracidiphilus sp.]
MISGTPTALAAKASYTVTASNSGGSTTASIRITVNPQPPSGLSYSQSSIVGFVDQAISPDTPTVTGTNISYAVSPTLPKGLSLDSSTGVISGTPTALAAKASYTVTASNSGGSTTASIQITVNPEPPSKLSYSQSSIAGFVDQAISPDTPTVTGTDISYAVSPTLPNGLSLDSSTGTISGTPASTSQDTYTVTASNAGGATTTKIEITVTLPPPTDLSYSEPAVDAAKGQAISADVPTVTGTVDSYAVAPALPAGLSLSKSTGTISGTPTALAPLTAYTVTASNLGGSTSATVLISVTVLLPAPTEIAYPQTVIGTYVGQAITPDIPAAQGTITSYVISPALPAGLSIDPSTGVISGTPTAAAPRATYVVTGGNSGGSVTAAINPKITVTPAPNILLQLGNQDRIGTLEFANSRVLSEDWYGLWILWDYKAGTVLANGDAGLGGANVTGFSSIYVPAQSAMAGPTVAIGIPGGIEVLSASDGHLLSTIVSPGFSLSSPGGLAEGGAWQLAADGSYIAVETQSGLYVYSTAGQLLLSGAGNYVNPNNPNVPPDIFAAPGQVQVAYGPVGLNVIETISIVNGTDTISPPFSGSFTFWFGDGERFLAGNSIYSKSGVFEAASPISAYPPYGQLNLGEGGLGNWIWLDSCSQSTNLCTLEIYAVGNANPALNEVVLPDFLVQSGTALGVYGLGSGLAVIDLSGAAPTETDPTFPPPINNASRDQVSGFPFAAVSSTEWVTGFANGLILDGASLQSKTPRFLGIGSALSISGSTANAAIATGSGRILFFDPANTTAQGSVGLTSGEVGLSSDGTVLAASSQDATLLKIESLPSETVDHTFSYSSQASPGLLFDFTLSGSGATLAQAMIGQNCWVQVSPTSGSPIIWSNTSTSNIEDYCGPLLLSPDGTLIAENANSGAASNTLNIYQNGHLNATIAGTAVGWIDNGRLLVNKYTQTANGPVFSGCIIYSPAGAALATPPLPELAGIQTVTPDTVYAPNLNAIYSLTTGKATWTSPYPPDSWNSSGNAWMGAIADTYVVFESEERVIAVKY